MIQVRTWGSICSKHCAHPKFQTIPWRHALFEAQFLFTSLLFRLPVDRVKFNHRRRAVQAITVTKSRSYTTVSILRITNPPLLIASFAEHDRGESSPFDDRSQMRQIRPPHSVRRVKTTHRIQYNGLTTYRLRHRHHSAD